MTSKKTIPPPVYKIQSRFVIRLVIVGFLVYAVFAGFSGLRLSLQAVSSAEPIFVVAAALAVVASYMFAGLTYKLLSPKHIAYLPTLLVQVSGGLVNRLLPAGLGGLGINLLYLKKSGCTVASATAVVATNNTLGLIGNALLILLVGIFVPVAMPEISLPAFPLPIVIAIPIVLLAVVMLIARSHAASQKVRTSAREVLSFVIGLARDPVRSLAALLSSCALTASHAGAMYCVMLALHIHLPWPVALLAVSAGSLAGAAVPTPGGLGGAEAGIAATLLTFSVSSSTAVAVALIYRGLTYWLPLVPGYFALRIVEKRYLY